MDQYEFINGNKYTIQIKMATTEEHGCGGDGDSILSLQFSCKSRSILKQRVSLKNVI